MGSLRYNGNEIENSVGEVVDDAASVPDTDDELKSNRVRPRSKK